MSLLEGYYSESSVEGSGEADEINSRQKSDNDVKDIQVPGLSMKTSVVEDSREVTELSKTSDSQQGSKHEYMYNLLSLDFEKKMESYSNDLKKEAEERNTSKEAETPTIDQALTVIQEKETQPILRNVGIKTLITKPKNVRSSQVKHVERNMKRFIESGSDFSNLGKVSGGLLIQNISSESVQESAEKLSNKIFTENEELLLRSVHLEAKPDSNQVKYIKGEANRTKNQIGTLLQSADDYRLDFERKQKRSRYGSASASSKYGW